MLYQRKKNLETFIFKVDGSKKSFPYFSIALFFQVDLEFLLKFKIKLEWFDYR